MQPVARHGRAGAAFIEAGAYVLFNYGASVPAVAAAKCASHPRARTLRGQRGLQTI
jgi:hypothetical protein